LVQQLTANTEIAENIKGNEVDNLIKLALLLWVGRLELPESVQPIALEGLLGSEESTNEAKGMLSCVITITANR